MADINEIIMWTTNCVVIGFLTYFAAIFISRAWLFVRGHFKARVNCWFCNQNFYIKYEDRNQFTCRTCHQYNGFGKDGDYNKEIQAQYSPRLNHQFRMVHPNPLENNWHCPSVYSGGRSPRLTLCEHCNRHQDMKIHQLASFTASSELTYTKELESFKEHLEDVYRLCPSCDRLVRRKINQDKALIIGLKRSNGFNHKTDKDPRYLMQLGNMFDKILSAIIIVLIGQYFYNSNMDTFLREYFQEYKFDAVRKMWPLPELQKNGNLIALGLAILQFVPITHKSAVDYLKITILCFLNIIIEDNIRFLDDFTPFVRQYSRSIEWSMQIIALFIHIIGFVGTFCVSPSPDIKIHNSFHKIQLEVDEEQEEEDSRSLLYGSWNSNLSTLSHNSKSHSSLHLTNRTGFSPRHPEHEFFENPAPSIVHEPCLNYFASSSPKKDRFSDSIRSLHITKEHQRSEPRVATPFINPFMKNVQPISRSPASLASSSCYTTVDRSILTPSRLSFVSGMASLEAKKCHSWLNGGFNVHQYPNVFTSKPASAFEPINKTKRAEGQREFNSWIDMSNMRPSSRASSESSGFETRQSTTSSDSPWTQVQTSTESLVRNRHAGLTDTMRITEFFQPENQLSNNYNKFVEK